MQAQQTTTKAPRGRGGFSLVEVALALTVAAGGMVAIFGLFPAGLRQATNSGRDVVGSSFANAALSAIAANAAQIDDVGTWNDPEKWWKQVRQNTGLPDWNKRKTYSQFQNDNSVFLPNRSIVSVTNSNNSVSENLWYFAEDDGTRNVSGDNADGVVLPQHYIIRLVQVRRKPRIGRRNYEHLAGYVNAVDRYGTLYGGNASESSADSALRKLRAPDRYVVSLISSDQKGYSIFVDEPVYSQEFHFLHRP